MSEQVSLEGFDAPAAPTDRLFFAFMPDVLASERAERMTQALCAQHGVKPRIGSRERFHITLFHVGDFVGWPEHTVAQACRAADAFRAEPCDIHFDRLVSFAGGPRRLPYVLLSSESSALTAFQAALSLQMHKAALTQGANRAKFTPHLTLLYGHQRLEEQAIDPIIWTARKLVLVRSLIGLGRYETVGRWGLGDHRP